jgi:ribosomal protein S27E
MGESEREGGRRSKPRAAGPITVQMLCRCPQCRAVNQFVIDWNKPRKLSKCQGCGEVIPTGGYKVIAHTNDLTNPLF